MLFTKVSIFFSVKLNLFILVRRRRYHLRFEILETWEQLTVSIFEFSLTCETVNTEFRRSITVY